MTPVDQTVVDSGFGNCHQAVMASLFDLDITQVPNFILYPDTQWWTVYWYFIYGLGYEWVGTGYPGQHSLADTETINGSIEAVVPSRTFPGKTHAVLIDSAGVVVHDPNPNKLWQGVNVLESGDLKSWSIIEKRNQ